MSTDFIKHVLESLKLSPKNLVAISLVLGFLLFAPAEATQWLGVTNVAKDYRHWIGIAFLSSTTLLLVTVSQFVYSIPRKWVGKRRFNRKVYERLGRLTEDEKQILRFYMANKTRTNSLRADDGVVQALAGAHIIFRVSNSGHSVNGFAYNISEFAWDVLNKEESLLDGTTNLYRTDKRDDW